MASDPTKEQLATEKAEELSRFESEGGSAAYRVDESRDRGLLLRDDDQRGRVLIIHATQERHTCAIADALALRLRSYGFAVEIGDARTGMMPPPQDYDIVILGLPMAFGSERALIAKYVEENRGGLADVPSALFIVSTAGTSGERDPGGFLHHFLRSVGWQPVLVTTFAGCQPLSREGVLLKLATWIGHSSASHEDAALRASCSDVQCFADAIATLVRSAATTRM